jgi:hypothetical protein
MLSESSIIAKYKRAKLKTSDTLLWNELSEDEKNKFLNKIQLNNQEKCIIVYRNKEGYFWVITNTHLIVGDNPLEYISYDSIEDIKLPSLTNKNSKESNNSIDLTTKKGRISLLTEERTWHFVYELLRFLKPR